jgi:hypothetical protein
MPSQEWTPLPRCCPRHSDIGVLTRHLIDDFPELQPTAVVRQVLAAEQGAVEFGLDAVDVVETVELVVRYQLALLSGRLDDAARLDPQPHPARSR